ncbi:Co-chaperone [Entomophthora muscae]|uniref:Co-chaperone n=1 Tax=Entomophthora muscae TaxID=34485 RepID=A0ACC2SZT6_9FUNG|nr:Co-chaperone [Entomophthora muscae]
MFDLKVKIEWSGKPSSGQTGVMGTLEVPEICHDSDSSDYVFEVLLSGNDNSSFGSSLLKLARNKLAEEVKDVILDFDRSLIERHIQDVHIEPEKINSPAPASPVSKPINENKTTESGGNLTLEFDFYAPAFDVYKVLTDAKLITIWSKCNTTFVPAPGLPFKLFSSTIKGSIISVTKYSEIVLSWRSQGWPEGVHSTVTIKLEDDPSSKKNPKKMKLTIIQNGIPSGWEVNTERHWRDEVVAPIISTFMFGEPSEHIGARALRSLTSLPLFVTASFGLTASALVYFYLASRS